MNTLYKTAKLCRTKALLSAKSIDLKLKGDMVNSGLMAARGNLSIDAANITNLTGTIKGLDVSLVAAQDIQSIQGNISAGNTLKIGAGNDVVIKGGAISAGGSASITAGNDLLLIAQDKGRQVNINFGKRDKDGKLIDPNNKDNILNFGTYDQTGVNINVGGGLTMNAGHDLFAQGAQINAGGGIYAHAGNNATSVTAKHGSFTVGGGKQTNFLGAIDSKEVSRTTTSRNFLWQSEASTGTKSETMRLANIQIPANSINFQGTGGISVQIPKGSNLSTQIATLAKQPGNEYLGQLANRSDIDWKQVELINKSWNYSKSGLTPEAKIIVGIAVSFLLPPGAGAGLFQSATGIALTGPAAAMANAALVTLTTQTSIAIINNKGDIGAALKELGSKDNIKALVTSIATAGILDKIGSSLSFEIDGKQTFLNKIDAKSPFVAQLGANLLNSVTSSLISTAVYGGSLEQNLKNALKTGFINTLGAQGANAIGDLKLDDLGAAIAHGILGCAIGSATAGSSSGCAAGAAGGAVGEYAAKWYGEAIGINGITDPKALEKAKAEVINFAKLTSAIVAGAGGAEGMNLAVLTGSNAATNNYLNHAQLTSLDKDLKACEARRCSQADKDKILNDYVKLSKENDAALAACTTQECVDKHKIEIAKASTLENSVLFNIDGRQGFELRGRQVKVEALKTQYDKVQFYENEAKEFANFYKAKCATGSMSDCVQAYTNMKTGNIQALKDLKGSAKEFWGSFADDPNQNAAKTFMAVTGLTLAELLPTHTAEIAALLPYGSLLKGARALPGVASDLTTTTTLRAATAFDSLDAAMQAKWATQNKQWITATTELAEMELAAGSKSHPLLRHGDQIELNQLRERAMTGLTPDGISGFPVNSTRWLSNVDELTAIKQAQARYRVGDYGSGSATNPAYTFDMGKVVGDGYYKNSTTYSQTSNITVSLFPNGLPKTAFPVLPFIRN